MATSSKERRAETAMRTIMGIGGMTAISLLIMATPAKAHEGGPVSANAEIGNTLYR